MGIKWAGKCVTRAVKATGHAFWLSFQEYGYIMAAGYLPQDETSGLVNPVVAEYQRNHSS